MAAGNAGEKESGGGMSFIVALVALLLIGAGAGYGFVQFTGVPKPVARAAQPAAEAKAHGAEKSGEKHAEGRAGEGVDTSTMLALDPIIVNLAKSQGRALRLEAYVIYDKPPKDDQSRMLKIMAEDALMYLRTISIEQVESASGLEFLREDLSELVQLRTKRAARGLLIKGLMIE